MMGMLGDKGKKLAMQISSAINMPNGEMSKQDINPGEKEQPGIDLAMSEIISAIHNKDAKALRSALESFHEMHESVIHEANESKEEEKAEHKAF